MRPVQNWERRNPSLCADEHGWMGETMKKNTKNFASRWGFILTSVGSAVGMANVWGFPNKLGSNGGGAFLLIYLLFIFIFSYVGLPA